MRKVIYLRDARKALRRYRADAGRLIDKITAYAADPRSQANNVKRLKGSRVLRLRVGDFRVVLTEDEDSVQVIDIGPRGSIYEWREKGDEQTSSNENPIG